MAAYNTITKIIVGQVPSGTEDSGTSGTLSAQINDFWQSLDSTSGAVQSMTAVQLSPYTIAVIIVYLG
jgi:hypothetical protein|tara:strand:- start:462 stop:665 length:204 start_codon:yes stop_codon:yes gene_type:complete